MTPEDFFRSVEMSNVLAFCCSASICALRITIRHLRSALPCCPKKCDEEACTTRKQRILRWASIHNQVYLVRICVETYKADVNCTDMFQRTPLLHAVMKGYGEIAQYLLIHGADPNFQDQWEWSPLMEALWFGHDHIAAMLLRQGAEANIDQDEWVPVAAVRGGRLALATILQNLS